MRPVHREAVAWASRTLRVGVGWGPDRGFLHTRLQALFSAGWMTVGVAWTTGGALGLPSSAGTAVVGKEVALP